MVRPRCAVFCLILVLAIPIASLTVEEARGGQPIFSAGIQAVCGNYANNTQEATDMEVDSDGRIYILYQSDHSFIWGNWIVHSDDGGRSWSDPARVDDLDKNPGSIVYNTNVRMDPRMTIGPDGAVYVVWQDFRKYNKKDPEEPESREIRIFMSKAADGESFTNPVRVDRPKTYPNWHSLNPDITINSAGELFCVWSDQKLAGAYTNIWGARSYDGGVSWTDSVMINDDTEDNNNVTTRNHDRSRCVMDGSYVYVTWDDGRYEGFGVKPQLAVSEDGGMSFRNDTNVSIDSEPNAVRNYAYPELDDLGNLYIVWSDHRQDMEQIFFTRSEDTGITLTPDHRMSSVPDGNTDGFPHIAGKGDGLISIVWERSVPYKGGDDRESWFINSTDGGRTWDRMMRCDDTDRYMEDLTDQEKPLVAYDDEGRPVCCWRDGRNNPPSTNYRDLFFSRHSGSFSGLNNLPIVYNTAFSGEFPFNPVIGNGISIFNFSCTYMDSENDAPLEGYPRFMIFSDPLGKDPLFDNWLVMEKVKGPTDVYYMEGVDYNGSTNVPVEGQFHYRIEIREEREPGSVFSPVQMGPRIDLTPPTLTILSPEPEVWMSDPDVLCRVRVEDTGGGWVNPDSIQYQKSVNGLDKLERGVRADGWEMLDNSTYEAWATVRLKAGIDNYVLFKAWDRVGNGPAESDPVNLWIDPDPPYVAKAYPGKNDVQLYTNVNCSVVWRDKNPGNTVMPTVGFCQESVKYCYRTTSGEYSEWMEPDEMVELGNESYLSFVRIEFSDKGVYNYIKWMAADLLGNEYITGEMFVNVKVPENYPPRFVGGVYPDVVASETPHLFWDPAFDEEGDDLTYSVMLLSHPGGLQKFLQFRTVGDRQFYDVEDALPIDHYKVQVKVADSHGGTDMIEHIFRIVETGTPPPERLPSLGPYFISDPNATIQWDPIPSDGYMVRMGTDAWRGDVIEWRDVGSEPEMDIGSLALDIGAYSFQVLSYNEGGRSRVQETMLKINDYRLEVTTPAAYTAYRGIGALRADPLSAGIVNLGTFEDNVSVVLEGELADNGWAVLSKSESIQSVYLVRSSKGRTIPQEEPLGVIIRPPEDAPDEVYTLRFRVISEDGSTEVVSDQIQVSIEDFPSGPGSGDEESDFVTDLFPFLDFLPGWLRISLFFLVVLLLLVAVVAGGILIAKRKRGGDDPYAEQRQIYKDLYGEEPTPEALDAMGGKGAAKAPEGGAMDLIRDVDTSKVGGAMDFIRDVDVSKLPAGAPAPLPSAETEETGIPTE